MIRPLRKLHFITWHLLAVLLPAGIILAIAFRPDTPERAPHSGESFIMEIRKPTDSTAQLLVTLAKPLEVPSCMVFAMINGRETLLGQLDRPGQHEFKIPATGNRITIRLYDALGKKTIQSFNLSY